jgi:7-cyano-7-deazaguanine reductase
MDPRDTEGYEGKQDHIPEMKIEPEIGTVRYVYSGKKEVVRYYTDELTALCPKTGLPDFYHLEIEYIPDELIVELKSLKLYLTAYRDVGIFYEHLAMKIFHDIMEKARPKWLKITLKAAKRGGIGAEVVVDSNNI